MEEVKVEKVLGDLKITTDNLLFYKDVKLVGGHLVVDCGKHVTFQNLEEVGGDLVYAENTIFPVLRKVGADLVTLQRVLPSGDDQLPFPRLEVVGGKLIMRTNAMKFPKLARIFGNLECLAEGAMFPLLLSVGETLVVKAKDCQMPLLESVLHEFRVNAKSVSFPSLKSVGRKMMVEINDGQRFNLPNLRRVNGQACKPRVQGYPEVTPAPDETNIFGMSLAF